MLKLEGKCHAVLVFVSVDRPIYLSFELTSNSHDTLPFNCASCSLESLNSS